MKKLISLLLVILALSCSKVTQKRLEGIWKVTDISEISGDNAQHWKDLLATTQVKAAFYHEGGIKIFYFVNDLLTNLESGAYLLSEEDGKLTIDIAGEIFNPRGHPLDVTSLHRKSLTLEGRYYLRFLDSLAPLDSFITLRWDFEQ